MGIRGDHQQVRRRLVRAGGAKWCPRCGGPILPGQPVDLDHLVPRSQGGKGPRVLSHRYCNRSHGAKLGNARRRARTTRRIIVGKRISLGVEITADRSRTVLVAVSAPEPGVAEVEMLPHVDGTDAVATVLELWELFDLAAVVVDPKSNASTLAGPLRHRGMPLKTPAAEDLAVAHGRFLDLLNAGKLRHHRQPELTAAIRYATGRRLAGASAIQRYGGQVDPAPAVAAELGLWGLGAELDEPGGPEPGAWMVGEGPEPAYDPLELARQQGNLTEYWG